MKCLQLFLLLLCFIKLSAQNDPEFPKEFIMHANIHQGMVTNFHNTPDQYNGGLQLVPQYTLAVNKIRGGMIAGVFYTGKKWQVGFGPTFSIKLKTIRLKPFGSGGNIHVNIDHLWGTEQQQLIGGGINLDLANKLILAFKVHRDYNLNNWWLQQTIGIRISKIKKKKPIDL